MTSSAVSTWLNPWQLQTGHLNPLQVKPTLQQLQLLSNNLQQLRTVLQTEISEHLHDFTAEEWIGTNITPKLNQLDNILSRAAEIIKL